MATHRSGNAVRVLFPTGIGAAYEVAYGHCDLQYSPFLLLRNRLRGRCAPLSLSQGTLLWKRAHSPTFAHNLHISPVLTFKGRHAVSSHTEIGINVELAGARNPRTRILRISSTSCIYVF